MEDKVGPHIAMMPTDPIPPTPPPTATTLKDVLARPLVIITNRIINTEKAGDLVMKEPAHLADPTQIIVPSIDHKVGPRPQPIGTRLLRDIAEKACRTVGPHLLIKTIPGLGSWGVMMLQGHVQCHVIEINMTPAQVGNVLLQLVEHKTSRVCK